MQNSKLIDLLRTLGRDELKKFDDFVASPYFNRNSNAIKLLRFIENYSPKYRGAELEKEYAYSQIFPGKPYNDKIMKNLMSELLNLGEKFLEQINYEMQKNNKYPYLLSELLKRNLFKNFEKNLKQAEESFKSSFVSEENYYNILLVKSLVHGFELRTKPGLERVTDIKILFDSLFALFAIFYFKVNHILCSRQKDYNFQYDFEVEIEFSESLLKYIKQKSLNTEPVILIYYYMFMTGYTKEDDYYSNLMNLFNEHSSLFSNEEKYSLFMSMVSFGSHKLSLGEKEYAKTSLEIYKKILKTRINPYSGKSEPILPLIFKNVVKSGIMAKEYNWLMEFVEEYKDKLSGGFDTDLYNFSLANIYFKMKNFSKAFECLSSVNYENVYDKLDVRCLLIQLYFETGSHENMISQSDSFKHFLNNDKLLSKRTKDTYLNFIRFIDKLMTPVSGKDKKYFIETNKKELSSVVVYDKGWLSEKFEEYKV